MRVAFLRFVSNQSGATAIEYALIGSLVCVAIVVGAMSVGGSINTMLTSVANSFVNPVNPD
jgi:pilus assembly protein Flp/PilA